jgi:prepilin-type N-terminal cleavage/methylation domain-containing protein
MNRSNCRRGEPRGFGLTELMIALTVMGAVLIAVFAVFFRSQATSSRMTNLVDARQNARAAIQLLERDLRMAGSGWGRMVLNASVSGVATQLRGLNVGYTGGVANDSLYLIGGWSASTSIVSSTMTTASSNLKVASLTGFSTGDLLVITNGQNAELMQCTGLDVGNSYLLHATAGSIYNTPAGFTAWPAGGFGPGSLVYRATWVSYRFDSTNFKRPCLVRQEFGQTPAVAAWNVNSFQIYYLTQDSVLVRNPSNINMIDEILPVVHFADITPTNGTRQDSVWSSVRPRTF